MALASSEIEWVRVADTSPLIGSTSGGGRPARRCRPKHSRCIAILARARAAVSGAQPDDIIKQGDTLVTVAEKPASTARRLPRAVLEHGVRRGRDSLFAAQRAKPVPRPGRQAWLKKPPRSRSWARCSARDLDVGGRQQEDLVGDALHAAVQGVREAAGEVDQPLRELGVDALQVEDHGRVVLEAVGDLLRVVEAARDDEVHAHRRVRR